jgi:hypothetical protein
VSVVVPPPGSAFLGMRRRVLPVLCAALLAVPLVALPVVAGTALADAPAEQVAEVAEVAEVTDVPAVAEVPTVVEAPVVVDAPVLAEVDVAPVGHEEDDPDHAGPVPDDVARPDLVLGLNGPVSGWPGGEGSYTMTVANAPTATAPAADFTLVYTASAGQTVLSVRTPFDGDWACVLSDQARCTWVGALAPGQQAPPVTVTVGHGRRTAGALTGTATVTHLEGEVVLADNSATVVTAMEAPDFALAVGAPESAAAGDSMSMVLSVTNIGPGWATGFVVHGNVSDGVTVEGLSGTGFRCDVEALRCEYADELAPGLSAAVTLTGTVARSHAGGPVTTTAQVDQAAMMASAVTAVSAAPKPVAVAPVTAPVTAPPPAAPVAVAPVTSVASPAAARTGTPRAKLSPRANALPQSVTAGRPAVLAFTDAPTTLPFTGSRNALHLAFGVWLVLVGVCLMLCTRRRPA